MKVTYIVPAIGKKPGQRYIATWKMEPLMMAALSGLTPGHVEQELFDDRIELIDYDTSTDLVAITVETYTARRAYAIADRFRARGVRVVLGGYHVTLLPEEAAAHADAIVVRNAETVWGRVLADAEAGSLQARYDGGTGFCEVAPDKTLFAGKKYLPVGLVETGRGCGHFCEFCAIAGYYGAHYHPRDNDAIVADVIASGRKLFFFVDDNLVADPDHLMDLCDRLRPLKVMWAAQGTLELARNPELLAAMKSAGCELVLIGFESVEPTSLARMGKRWSTKLGDRAELVERIHRAGIGIYATFVLGYDGDTEETFTATLDFAKQAGFFTAAFNHLLPFPGTRLYQRLEAEDRLLTPAWWLDDTYHYGQVAYRPARLGPDQVSAMCRQARKDFAAAPVLADRGWKALRRGRARMWPVYWGMNARLGREVDEKFHVPIGHHLDELPK